MHRIFSTAAVALGLAAVTVSQSSAQTEGPSIECLIEPTAVVRVASATTGILDQVEVSPGDVVARGDVIARLVADVERANVDMSRARAEHEVSINLRQEQAEYARRKYERATALSEQSVLSEAKLDESKTEALLAEMTLAQAQFERKLAGLDLARAEAVLEQKVIRSPIDGVVTEQLLWPGEYAHEQAQVVTLAQLNPLKVRAFVPIAQYGSIRVGQTAKVQPEDPIGGLYEARVETVDRVFDAASGTFGVRMSLPNPDRKLPGGLRCTLEFMGAQQ